MKKKDTPKEKKIVKFKSSKRKEEKAEISEVQKPRKY